MVTRRPSSTRLRPGHECTTATVLDDALSRVLETGPDDLALHDALALGLRTTRAWFGQVAPLIERHVEAESGACARPIPGAEAAVRQAPVVGHAVGVDLRLDDARIRSDVASLRIRIDQALQTILCQRFTTGHVHLRTRRRAVRRGVTRVHEIAEHLAGAYWTRRNRHRDGG